MTIERKYNGDLGSNLMEAWKKEDVSGGWMGSKFGGYEPNRKAWNRRDVKDFEDEIRKNKKYNGSDHIILSIMGNTDGDLT